ncbi:MAG: Gfo/Idh/MocA family oxidoreductase [Verrucomicrobiaceae bacterium]|nr:Gfo/Idh/MocA family oxidoreductase [Verrucomicrobiaceae bacterium]
MAETEANPDVARIGVGVLGATGFIGTPYRAELRECPGVRIVALCARRPDLLNAAAEEDGAALATTDWREVVDHPAVNYVMVGTPDALHREAVLATAAAGKHLFCEKPVGKDAREAGEMLSAMTSDQGLAHFVPFWTRWSPAFVRARDLVKNGCIGDIKVVIYRWFNPRPALMALTWRDDPALSSGGTIPDVGSHAYDTLRWILGEDARRVLTHAETITPAKADLGNVNLTEALEPHADTDAHLRKGGTADYANISIEFESGIHGSMVLSHATYLRRGLAPELEFHGSEGSIAVDRVHGRVNLVRPGGHLEEVAEVPAGGFDLGNRFAQWVIPGLRAVLAGARQESLDLPNLRDGLSAQRFTDAALESARRSTWVALEEIAVC